MPSTKRTVLVTGFGPFGCHKVNASWVAVQELEKLGLGDDVDLVTQKLAVEYDTVTNTIPTMWQTHKPVLVVHVGVSGIATELTLEQQAHNDGYDKQDNNGTCPTTRCCVDGADNCIVSEIDMQYVCQEVNNAGIKVKAVVSHDAGRYLCDFSFFTSLHIDRCRAAFVHVPPLNTPYTAPELAEGLRCALLSMLKQVS
ncbi:pyroglutamyl-peptidase 1-like [Haliotis cracherodii]|uniref:pyroglutamyl-peptidase 1-like n=1 Tax=Haliotis cracherodii TaxID=6455 RepID=UPI0039EC4F2E